jgi:hypothetical protein
MMTPRPTMRMIPQLNVSCLWPWNCAKKPALSPILFAEARRSERAMSASCRVAGIAKGVGGW